MRKPTVARVIPKLTYHFRNEKEAHFFHLFVDYSNAPVTYVYHESFTNDVIVCFNAKTSPDIREFKATLKALCTTIDHAFPDFLTRQDKPRP